jgi:hypothetical protein
MPEFIRIEDEVIADIIFDYYGYDSAEEFLSKNNIHFSDIRNLLFHIGPGVLLDVERVTNINSKEQVLTIFKGKIGKMEFKDYIKNYTVMEWG